MSQFWRTSLLTGAVLFLETSAFYLVFSMIAGVLNLPQAGIGFVLTYVALLWSYLLSLYVQTVRFSLNLRGALGLVLSVCSLLILTNLSTGAGLIPFGRILAGDLLTAVTLILSLLFLVVLWWRGTNLAHDDITLESMRGSFQWGLAVIFAAVLMTAFSWVDVINGFIIMGFFGVGLLGLALARFTSETGEVHQGMSGTWLIAIGVTVSGVLLLGLIISLVGMGGLDDVTRAIFGFVGWIGMWVLRPILMGLGFIAAGLVALGNWLIGIFGGGDLTGLEEAARQMEQFHQSLEAEDPGGVPTILVVLLKWTAFLAAAAGVGWLLYRLFRFRRLLRTPGEVEEIRESLFSWERAGQDLSSMINEWWGNLVHASTGENRRRPAPRDPRELYHSFLLMAEELGHPRREGQTPREHQQRLEWVLPPEPVSHIVDGFQSVYYGQGQVNEGQMQGLLQDWQSLQNFVIERQRAESNGAAPGSEGGNGTTGGPGTA
jgi:hypothetical protein